MSTGLFLFRELLGVVRTKSAVFFVLSWILLFLFLASVACFFMMVPSTTTGTTEGQPIEEIHVFLSPRLSSATINEWYLAWREREDIDGLHFRFAQELDEDGSGSVFIVTPTQLSLASELASEFRDVEGVTRVIEVPRAPVTEVHTVSLAIRIGLLATLVLTITASLLCSRRGYRELLMAFSGEIRMLRLSGISERMLFVLVVALGVLLGLLGGLFLLAVLYLFHQIALSNATAFALFGGLLSGMRILGVGLMTLALGTILGGLAGLLGASLLHRREFDALP